MDTCKVKWTQLQSEIFRFLCINTGKELSLRNIAKQLKKSPTAVSNALKGLVKEELVKIKKSESMKLLLFEFDKKLERNIIINFYSSFAEIHKHLRDSILNGILLSGSVDL